MNGREQRDRPTIGPFGGRRAPRPGVVPLRPLGVGELVDGAVAYVREHPKVVLGTSAIVAVITQTARVVATLLLTAQVPELRDLKPGDPMSPAQLGRVTGAGLQSALPALAVTVLADAVLLGLLVVVIARSVLGEDVDGAECWRAARRRVPGLLGLAVIEVVAVAVAAAVGLLPALLIGLAAGAVAGLALGVLLGPFLVGLLVLVVLTFVAMSPAAYVLEDVGMFAALRRSAQLARHRFWPVLGTLALSIVIYAVLDLILGLVFALPASLVRTAVTGRTGEILATAVAGVGGVVSATLLVPFVAGVVGLLYVDARMRREGFDIELQHAAATGRVTG